MQKIDQFVLGVIEAGAHWFQRLTGKDNFWLAYVFLYPAIVADMRWGILQLTKGRFAVGSTSVFCTTAGLFALPLSINFVRKNICAPGVKNPLAISPRLIVTRFALVITLSILTGSDVWRWNSAQLHEENVVLLISGIFYITCMYLIACTPQPPKSLGFKKSAPAAA